MKAPTPNEAQRNRRRAERIADRVADRKAGIPPLEPIINATIDKAIDKATDVVADAPGVPDVTPSNAPVIADIIKEVLAADPKFQNATNNENPLQSGVAWGATVAIIGGIGTLGGLIYTKNFNPELYATPIVSILGGIFTLYRRFTPGLKPMFSGK